MHLGVSYDWHQAEVGFVSLVVFSAKLWKSCGKSLEEVSGPVLAVLPSLLGRLFQSSLLRMGLISGLGLAPPSLLGFVADFRRECFAVFVWSVLESGETSSICAAFCEDGLLELLITWLLPVKLGC